MTSPNDLPSVGTAEAQGIADLLEFSLPSIEGLEIAANMIRALVSERDALAGRVRELEAERDKLQTAAKLVLAWYEAEENHGETTFMQRVEMCRESEDALRAALKVPKGGV